MEKEEILEIFRETGAFLEGHFLFLPLVCTALFI